MELLMTSLIIKSFSEFPFIFPVPLRIIIDKIKLNFLCGNILKSFFV